MIRLALILCLIAAPVLAGTKVIDGDTIHVNGKKIRIMGLDTPETWKPRCLAEKMLGERATAYAKELAPRIARIVPDQERPLDKYGRTLARVYLDDGKDWAQAMIERGLAVPYGCPNGWCPRMPDWCGR